jgi:hypothetical protein
MEADLVRFSVCKYLIQGHLGKIRKVTDDGISGEMGLKSRFLIFMSKIATRPQSD